jgi:predicted kinase
VFSTLEERIKTDLKNGHRTIFDATNINKERRMEYLLKISDIECQNVCIFFDVPRDECMRRNAEREAKVPDDVIEKMYQNLQIPCISEGWDIIEVIR